MIQQNDKDNNPADSSQADGGLMKLTRNDILFLVDSRLNIKASNLIAYIVLFYTISITMAIFMLSQVTIGNWFSAIIIGLIIAGFITLIFIIISLPLMNTVTASRQDYSKFFADILKGEGDGRTDESAHLRFVELVDKYER